MSDKQVQKAGDNSQQIQAEIIVVNHGVDEKRVREILDEKFASTNSNEQRERLADVNFTREDKMSLSSMLGNQDDISSFHNFTKENYLKSKIAPIDQGSVIQDYSSLFKLLMTVKNGRDIVNTDCNDLLFDQIETLLKCSTSKIPVIVKGRAGYGKTLFLSILYLYLYENFRNGKSDKIPIYLSLHHYNKHIYTRDKRFLDQAKQKLEKDIEPIFSYIQKHPTLKVILIIDGTDEFANPKVDLDEHIWEMLTNQPINGQIIGLRRHTNRSKGPRRYPFEVVPEVEIEFNRMHIDSEGYTSIIHIFSSIESRTIEGSLNHLELESYIDSKVKKFGIKEIDYFHLFLFSKGFQARFKYDAAQSLSGFYKKYIEECGMEIQSLAELAFKTFNNPGGVSNVEKNSREWWKIQKHDSLRDYLTAYNIVEKLIDSSDSNDATFNFVYPYKLNAFCKEIINENIDNQKDVLQAVKKMIGNAQLTAKTHFCYLLGRFENDSVKRDSTYFLRALEAEVYETIKDRIPNDSIKTLDPESKKYLLYHRTICISLICLGDMEASSIYIRRLIDNSYFDKLNRGFHLEYYEDIPFLPESPDSLKNEDHLGCFDKTYGRLSEKILHALNTSNLYPLFQIELYTLCSLAQHRQANGSLEEEKRLSINEIICKSLGESEGICALLRTYLAFMQDRLSEQGKFKVSSFVKDFYSLKQLPRKGWLKRFINAPETVASHIYGTMLLAYMHLPSSIDNENGYDKKKIMQMLLVHDIGEEFIGDLTPEEKTETTKEEEKRRFEYLNLMGTYDGLSSKMNLLELYNNFTYNKKDINSVIAREIDKLDNLLQLYIYNRETPISDFDHFRADLKGYIETNIGKRIMNQIEELFETE